MKITNSDFPNFSTYIAHMQQEAGATQPITSDNTVEVKLESHSLKNTAQEKHSYTHVHTHTHVLTHSNNAENTSESL